MYLITKLSESILFKTTAFKLIIVLLITLAAPVYSQDSSQQLLKDGIKLYEEGKLDQAIAKLTSCVERGDLTKDQLTQAYKYLAQAYMAKEFRDQAKQAVEKLLNIMPNYKPDPMLDRPQYIELVEKVKAEQQIKEEQPTRVVKPPITPVKKKGKITTWLLIGGGAVVGVILAVILLSSGGGAEELPAPPALPGR